MSKQVHGFSQISGEQRNSSKKIHLNEIFETLYDVINDTEEVACYHIKSPEYLDNDDSKIEPDDSVSVFGEGMDEVPTSTQNLDENKKFDSITFYELNRKANALARVIAASFLCQNSLSSNDENNYYARRSQINDGVDILFNNRKELQANTIIGIYMPPSIDRIIVQLACWKLNLPYFPLDRQIPAKRMLEILRNVDPIGIIISQEYFEDPVRLIDDSDDDEQKNYSRLHGSTEVKGELMQLMSACGLLFYDALDGLIESRNISKENLKPNEKLFGQIEDPVLLILFSSGSTSLNPKGTSLLHSQMYNRLSWQWNPKSGALCLSLENNSNSATSLERGIAKSAWLFVDSFTETFSFLLCGLSIVIPGSDTIPSEIFVADIYTLSRVCQRFFITRITVVPAQLSFWLTHLKQFEKKNPQLAKEIFDSLSSLTTVICSGEILSYSMASFFFETFSKYPKQLVNLYGSTENAGDITYVVFDSLEALNHLLEEKNNNTEEICHLLPIGRPIDNTTIYIVSECESAVSSSSLKKMRTPDTLNTSLKLLPIGEIGEIAVSGDCISTEKSPYINNLKVVQNESKQFIVQTEQENSPKDFLRNPFSEKETNLFLTGDKGFISQRTNLIYFLGRNDDFIKVNGVLCTASFIDSLLSEAGRTNPIYQWINKSVTIGMVVKNQSKLVCFYTVKSNENFSTHDDHDDTGQGRMIRRNSSSHLRSRDILGLPISMLINCPLRPKHLVALMKNYLPIYLIPIFIQIDNIPYNLNCGKVDRFKLKEFFLSHMITKDYLKVGSSLKSAVNLLQPKLQSGFTNMLSHFNPNERPRSHTIIALKGMPNKFKSMLKSMDQSKREQARQVFATVLGLKTDPNQITDRPCDEEDFFSLGGDSLTIVRAIFELKRLHLPASIHLFATTSRIGDLLTSLEHNICALSMTQDSEYNDDEELKKPTFSPEEDEKGVKNADHQRSIGSAPTTPQMPIVVGPRFFNSDNFYYIEEWKENPEPTSPHRHVSKKSILDFLTKSFLEKDWITKAFNLSKKTLEEVINAYLKVYTRCFGVVILARGVSEFDIKAVAICLPSHQVTYVETSDENWTKVEQFFEAAMHNGKQINENSENILSTIMLSVESSKDILSADLMSEKKFDLNISKGEEAAFKGRLAIEILTVIEREIIKKAKEYSFTRIDTLNTNLATKAVCTELGYRLRNSYSLNDFLQSSMKDLNPSPEHKISSVYYMTKNIN